MGLTENFLVLILCLGTSTAVPESDFYPFGKNKNDAEMPANDDGSSPEIIVSTLFPFYNHQHRSLFVNNNGIISLQRRVSTYTPHPFEKLRSGRWIVPFWADVNTRNGGSVFYRETTDQDLLSRVTNELRDTGKLADLPKFRALWMFIATWKDVAFYGANSNGTSKRNTFQAVLATNGRHSFAIFNYARIEWTTGTASGGNETTGLGGTPAQVGFTYGDGGVYYAIDESLTPDIVNLPTMTNCGNAGKYIFRIEKEDIESQGCNTEGFLTVVPSYGSMLGGDEVLIAGPCFNLTNGESGDLGVVASVDFQSDAYSLKVDCRYHDNYTASCITPSMFVGGHVDIHLRRTDRTSQQGWNFTGHFSYVNIARISPQLIRGKPKDWTSLSRGNHAAGMQLLWNKTYAKEYLECDDQEDRVSLDLFAINESDKKAGPVHLLSIPDENGIDLNTGEYDIKPIPREVSRGHAAGTIRMTCWDQNFVMTKKSLWSDVHPLIWVGPATLDYVKGICDDWQNAEERRTRYDENLGPCPCNVAQARLDIGRFHSDPLCNRESSDRPGNCLHQSGAVHCIRSNAPPENELSGQQCCYDTNGNLIETSIHESDGTRSAGRTSRYHYLGKSPYNAIGMFPFISNYLGDEIPYQFCCEFSREDNPDRCEHYLQHRPALTNCSTYEPPRPARLAGDPHMVTLDGAKYTFNGLGEYTVVETLDNLFTMQARTEQAKGDNGELKQATVFTSVAMKGKNTDLVQIQRNEIWGREILVNGQRQSPLLPTWQDFKGLTILSTKGSKIVVTFNELAIGIELEVTKDLVNIVVIGSNSLRGNTRGLLGTWNGNTSDDFTFPDGRILQERASSRDIHNFGESWKIDSRSSLFTYERHRNHAFFNGQHFQPVFMEELSHDSATQEQRDICGNSTECLYDLLTTNNTGIARATRKTAEIFEVLIEIVKKGVRRCPRLKVPVHGRVLFYSGHYSGDVIMLTCSAGYRLVGSGTLTCTWFGYWTGPPPRCIESRRPLTTTTRAPPAPPVTHTVLVIGVSAALLVVCAVAVWLCVCIRNKTRNQVHEWRTPTTNVPKDPAMTYVNQAYHVNTNGHAIPIHNLPVVKIP